MYVPNIKHIEVELYYSEASNDLFNTFYSAFHEVLFDIVSNVNKIDLISENPS